MITIEKQSVYGFMEAIRGMRNPMNSWDKSDSTNIGWDINIGNNDYALMRKLAANGPVHAKYRRMIIVYADITAPLYWWKEFDTYKVGTVANSCSTMHRIHAREFTLDDFSIEHLSETGSISNANSPINSLEHTINCLNWYRRLYLDCLNLLEGREVVTSDDVLAFGAGLSITDAKKKCWWQMIQLLPSSYNQKRTVMLSYEVLANIYKHRKDHKLDEWRELCGWIETLPVSSLITLRSKG